MVGGSQASVTPVSGDSTFCIHRLKQGMVVRSCDLSTRTGRQRIENSGSAAAICQVGGQSGLRETIC